MSIARVTDDVAERDAFSRHLAENPDHGRHRVVVTAREVHPPHELWDLPCSVISNHGGERAVVAEEQLVFLTRTSALPGGSVGRRRLLAFPLSSLTPTVELHHLVGH